MARGNPRADLMFPAIVKLAGKRLAKSFTWWEVAAKTDLPFDQVISYFKLLEKAQVIRPAGTSARAAELPRAPRSEFLLLNAFGGIAPRISVDGQVRSDIPITQQMWNAIRVKRLLDWRDLHDMCACTEQTARTYLHALHHAGYLTVAQPYRGSGRNRTPSVFSLIPDMDTGPRAPMITRLKTVFDQNLRKIVWQESVREVAYE